MSFLANVGLAKADSPLDIQMLTSVGRPSVDLSSVEVAGAFPRSPISSPVLENVRKSALDYVREGSTVEMVGAAMDCSGSAATSTSVRAFVYGAANGIVTTLSSPIAPSSADGILRSIVGTDNAKIGSKIISDGMSDFLTSTNGVENRPFNGREGLASAAAFFLAACEWISVADTRALGCIAAIKIKNQYKIQK